MSSKAATEDWSLKPKASKVLINILNRNGNKVMGQKKRGNAVVPALAFYVTHSV